MNVNRIAIIGLGLIGGSLGLALKEARGPEVEVVGFARRPETATLALACGAVDRAERDLSLAVSGAQVIIVTTPILAIKDVFREIAGHLLPEAIVSDAGSTKAQIMEWAREFLPPGVNFIGGHPMTGKESSGLAEAEAALLKDCVYCLVPSKSSSQEAQDIMEQIVNWVGGRPVFLDADVHDEQVAGISHLPMLLSSALVSVLYQSELWPQMSKLAATGYRDSTRLASGSPEINNGICSTNRNAIAGWIDQYIKELSRYRRLVMDDNKGLEEALRAAQDIRRQWLNEEGRRFEKR